MCKLPVFFKADEPERKGYNALDFPCSLEVRKRNTLIIVASIANNQRVLCGKSGIRTRERLSAVTDFPGLPLQPLEHHSKVDIAVSVSSAPESEICCFNGYDFKSQREVNAFL